MFTEWILKNMIFYCTQKKTRIPSDSQWPSDTGAFFCIQYVYSDKWPMHSTVPDKCWCGSGQAEHAVNHYLYRSVCIYMPPKSTEKQSYMIKIFSFDMALRSLSRKKHLKYAGYRSDIWAVTCLLHYTIMPEYWAMTKFFICYSRFFYVRICHWLHHGSDRKN